MLFLDYVLSTWSLNIIEIAQKEHQRVKIFVVYSMEYIICNIRIHKDYEFELL